MEVPEKETIKIEDIHMFLIDDWWDTTDGKVIISYMDKWYLVEEGETEVTRVNFNPANGDYSVYW